jgi:hypothetical protein
MFRSPRTSDRKAASALLFASVLLCPSAKAQDFTTQVGNSDPLGLTDLVPLGEALSFGAGPGLKGGFAYGLGVEMIYDSNLFLRENTPESELSTNLRPWLSYTTDPEGGAKWSIDANYNPTVRDYLNNSDLNAFDQSADIALRYVGSKASLTAYSRISELTGTDRLTGKFVTGTLLNNGIQAGYQIAPRTSLLASCSAAISDYGTSSLVGANIYSTQIGAYWAATERLSFGPGIRYNLAESDNTGSRDAWALYMQTQYRVGERILVLGSLGLEYAKSSRDGQNSTLGLTGNLSASYAISQRWALRGLVQYVTIPSPTDTNYVINNLLISTGLDRSLLRATVGGGIDLNFSNYEGVGVVGSSVQDENSVSTYLSYRRKLFSESLDFQSKLSYSFNSGQVDWKQLQVFTGLEVQF